MSKQRNETPLTLLCHPYLFALKEGDKIACNPLDYSLLLLQRRCAEVIKSPKISKLLTEATQSVLASEIQI